MDRDEAELVAEVVDAARIAEEIGRQLQARIQANAGKVFRADDYAPDAHALVAAMVRVEHAKAELERAAWTTPLN